MQKTLGLLAVFALIASLSTALNAARIKDITDIGGIRYNQLEGMGIVSGLDGKGDRKLDASNRALVNAIRQYGLTLDIKDVDKAKNFAFVKVIARIGPFAKSGDTIDVNVSAIGNASSLQGGVLWQCPLTAANGMVYAVAQGPVQVGGFVGGDLDGSAVQKNHPTTGIITRGAIVERSINTKVVNLSSVDFKLKNPDFTTSVRVADSINRIYPASAQAIDPATVNVLVPRAFQGQTTNFIAAVGRINVTPDVPARVVVNERTGTIVATDAVTLSPVAISYGSLIIKVVNDEQIIQPGVLAGPLAVTATQENQQLEVIEQMGKFQVIPTQKEDPTIRDLADALNSLGVTTRDMINIFQTLQRSGALHADLLVE